MVDYKQILRLRAEGVSQRGIAEVLGYHQLDRPTGTTSAANPDTGTAAHLSAERRLAQHRNSGPHRA